MLQITFLHSFLIWKAMQLSYLCHIVLRICSKVLVLGKGLSCAGLSQSTKLVVPLWKLTLRQGKKHQTRMGGGEKKEWETAIRTPRSEKEWEEVLHGARTSIHIAACGTDHAGVVGYFVMELQPMANPCRSREVWEGRSGREILLCIDHNTLPPASLSCSLLHWRD